jgi:hypothetical protein
MSAGRYVPAFFMSIAVLSAAASAAPTPTPITPQLVDAAFFYTSIELQTGEKIGKAFERKDEGLARPSTLRARTKAWMRGSGPRKTTPVHECESQPAILRARSPRTAGASTGMMT